MFQTRSVLRWWWQRHAPKSRLLNFKGTLKTGTWDDKSREIPCPSKLKEPEISNFNSSKHATLNCNYYCDCRWKTVVKTVVTSAEAPSLCRPWRPPRPSPPTAAWRTSRGRRVLQDAAESDLSTAGVGGTTCCGSRRLLSSRGFWAPGPIYHKSYLISSDQHSHCPLFTLVHGYPRRVPSANVKEKDELQNYCTCFNKMCCVDRDRDTPQNHGSWISGELWRREPEMINPGKSHAHRSWKNLKFQILIHQNMPHWTATIIVIAGEKLFSKRLWHRLRPPASVVLDVHRGLRCQQQLGALHAAVDCCIMQRSPTSAPPASEAPAATPGGFWAPGPLLLRTSTGAPFARRKATTAVWSNRAAACSAARRAPMNSEKSWSRQRRSRRRWPRTAARSPLPAASMMSSSRRAEKCSRNEVPHFLWSLCFIFSKSKSATYGNYME